MNITENTRIFTVGELNQLVKGLLESNPMLQGLYIKGEISNFKNHTSGHFYFTLKDEGGAVKSVMFRSSAGKLKFLPENGMRVIVHGRLSLYPPTGDYQLYADNMEPDGVGALYVAYEQLRRRLEAEGLFSPARKRPIPKIPGCVGVITSPTGAAVQDILDILGRRFPFAKVLLFPALVQGEGAVPSLLEGIAWFSESRAADVVIIGRGGGSIEDLWAFNDEGLARAIAACPVPVISAVGHETDFTICDFAADLRAPTPSAAAELAVPVTEELQQKFLNVTERMKVLLQKDVAGKRQLLRRYAEARVLRHPEVYWEEKRLGLDYAAEKLGGAMQNILRGKRAEFVAETGKLEALNPMAVISRGYAAVYDEKGTVLKSVRNVRKGERFRLRMKDGQIDGIIDEIIPATGEEGLKNGNRNNEL